MKANSQKSAFQLIQFRSNERKMVMWTVGVIVIIMITVIISYVVSQQPVNKNPSNIRILLLLHTSNGTGYKYPHISQRYIKQTNYDLPQFFTILVGSDSITEHRENIHLLCPCNDERLSPHGLNCRLDCALQYFNKKSDSDWLFNGDDDDYINFDALERFLDILDQLYDPKTQSIFVANLQLTNGMPFPHGGPGWIASRHFVSELLRRNFSSEQLGLSKKKTTDDISMGIFLQKKFPSLRFWAYPWSILILPQNSEIINIFEGEIWEKLPTCQNAIALPSLSDIISVHYSPFNTNWLNAIQSFQSAPSFVKVVAGRHARLSFCRCVSYFCNLKMNKKSVSERIRPEAMPPRIKKGK